MTQFMDHVSTRLHSIFRVRLRRLFIATLAVATLATLGSVLIAGAAQAQLCGDEGQVNCCAGESNFGQCLPGLLIDDFGSQGQCPDLTGKGLCVAPEVDIPCGGLGERACCALETSFGACEPGQGLTEYFPGHTTGKCGNTVFQSQSFCMDITGCGLDGERQCCIQERSSVGNTISGCEEWEPALAKLSFASAPPGSSGPLLCVNGPQADFGDSSPGFCRDPTCGDGGERGCCASESANECSPGLVAIPVPTGTFQPCSNSHGRSLTTCVTPESACGENGQRNCCAGEAPGLPSNGCAVGTSKIPGCSGNCYCGEGTTSGLYSSSMCAVLSDGEVPAGLVQIAEPTVNCTNCTPVAQPPENFCSLRGVADMHLHQFTDLAHGGAAFVGKSYDPDGGVNEALKHGFGTTRTELRASNNTVLFSVNDGIDAPPLNPECPAYLKNVGACDGMVTWHAGHTLFQDVTGTGIGDEPASPLGAPLFNGWPTSESGVHQQAYFKWIERAYLGGLRLTVMHAVHSEAACAIAIREFGPGSTPCSDSMAWIDSQLDEAYAFQTWLDSESGGPGLGWYRIVTTPSEARNVISEGKLAVVLAIEVDNLFNCKKNGPCPNMPGHPELTTVEQALDYYHDVKGVRHIFPVHNFDNYFAGTATWLTPLDSANRFVEDAWWTTQDCALSPPGQPGYGQRLAQTSANGLFSLLCSISGFTGFCGVGSAPQYLEDSSCNVRGLTFDGDNLVNLMMAKGMLIDIDHMSNQSLNDTLLKAESANYPLVASHGLFFDLHDEIYEAPGVLGLGRTGRHERMRTRAQLDRMAALGSLVAVMTMDDVQITNLYRSKRTKFYAPRRDTALRMPFVGNGCRHSSLSFANAYSYAVDVMEAPVAFGTDFNGVAQHIGARFGSRGCGGEPGTSINRDRHWERAQQERRGNQLSYPFTNEFGTFNRQVTGLKTFDFNYDGLAHVGLLPDMIADLKQVGLSDQQLEPILTSANKYIEVWEQARGEVCVPEPGVITGLMPGLALLAVLGAGRRRRESALQG